MHQRWRERAVELARVEPGSRALDVATGTGDLAIALRAARRRGGRAATSPRRCSSWRATQGAVGPRSSGQTRSTSRTTTTRSTPPRSGFGARNFSDLGAGPRRDGAGRAARRPRRGARDHDAAEAAAVLVLLALVRPRRARARPAGGRPGRLHVPAELGEALPRPARRSPAELAAAGLDDVRWVLTAGGIIAIHAGTVAR